MKTWEEFDSFKSDIELLQLAIDGVVEQVVELRNPYNLIQKEKALHYLGHSRNELGKLLFDTESNLKALIGERKVEEVIEEPAPVIETTSPFTFDPSRQ